MGWMPIDGRVNTWVEIRDGGQCSAQTHLDEHRDVTRYVLCCKAEGDASSRADNGVISFDGESDQIFGMDETHFHPVTYTRSQGWSGSTYGEALEFCALQKSKVPCPYDAICPMASRGPPFGGAISNSAWAPIIDSANGWVQIGNKDTCMKYTDVHPHPPTWGLTGKEAETFTSHILCCEEPEGSGPHIEKVEEMGQLTNAETIIVSTLHPVWFGRKHGYHGTTHEEAELLGPCIFVQPRLTVRMDHESARHCTYTKMHS